MITSISSYKIRSRNTFSKNNINNHNLQNKKILTYKTKHKVLTTLDKIAKTKHNID